MLSRLSEPQVEEVNMPIIYTAGTRYDARICRLGFTLIEVLIAIVIMGIAGAIIVPHMLASGTLGVQAASRMVIADILFAQNDAISQQADRQVFFDTTGNQYRLADGSGNTLTVDWKGGAGEGQNYVVDFANDNRFSGIQIQNVDFGVGSQRLVFDALGTPASGGKLEVAFQGVVYQIDVAPFTGRVTIHQIMGD